ncbi:uncharacterized protein LOC128891601 isoform X2 [Hylaeus anthracinus]|uniref:uncharacterized protein LOC128891601 isoform X2 n=1 Tax=Hylaeus anthracinus TaxID=313031 RepID=UPI0023B9CC65|nr:uncharacterized protein LOC128891601 isoform X2 [Hylaeus anthracinus]XP_054007187.1 uncharacterized protein LOC128891601 isoform X2 [Hylaeus anthracinus]
MELFERAEGMVDKRNGSCEMWTDGHVRYNRTVQAFPRVEEGRGLKPRQQINESQRSFGMLVRRSMSADVRAGRPTMPTIPQTRRTILVYPTVTPESIIIPIVSCILGFPLLALMVICCLRRRAKLARERARRRNCDLDHGALSLVRFSPVHRLAPKEDLAGIDRSTRAVSFRSDRGSRAFSSLDLDTVVEERSDPEQSTALELSSPD